ncbi:DUF177 domain-containing protein [Pseudomonadota bacterium]
MTYDKLINATPEFSRIVQLDQLVGGSLVIELDPSQKELDALAERFDVDALMGLRGKVEMSLLPNDDVLLMASFQARVKQHCSVTLQPMESDISAMFTTTYTESLDPNWGHDEEEFEDVDEDIEPPEAIVDGKIDIGEAVAEQLALEIDPFPRVQDATFDGFSTDPGGESAPVPEKKNPFAVLEQLKTKQKNTE